MIRMLDRIDIGVFSQRTWVYTSGDSVSAQKATSYEETIKTIDESQFQLIKVPRARKVGEGLLSTIKSSLMSSYACLAILSSKPDLVRSIRLV